MPIKQVDLRGSYVVVLSDGTTQTRFDNAASQWIEDRPVRIRSRKATGWLFPTSYYLDTQVRRKPTGTVTGTNGTTMSGHSLEWFRGNVNEMNLLDVPPIDPLVTKALLDLKDQSINVGVAIAEAKRTANLVASTATRLARAYQHLRKREVRKALDFLGVNKHHGRLSNNSSKAWLELQYGWKPLLQDVRGAAEELARMSSDSRLWVHTVKSSARVKDSGDYIAQSLYPKRVRWHRESGAYLRLDYEPGNTFLSAMSRTGVTNPLEVAWELVPFSFVVDWFLPVGNYLSTLDATVGWQFKSGSVSYLQRSTVRESGIVGGYVKSASFEGSFKRTRFTRIAYDSSPRPTLPRFKNPVSVGHVANALALLSAVFGGKR